MSDRERQEFLVVYNYGQGGIWGYVRADAAGDIEQRFPELDVVNEKPGWMTPELEERIRRNRTVDIEETDTGFLADLIAERNR